MARSKLSIVETHGHLIAEWCETNKRKPEEITAGSSYRATWKCVKNSDHPAWVTKVYARALKKTGCPYCSKKKTYKGNSLATTHKTLAKEW